MSLEDLGNIGEFVAAVAVVISLVYLAIQIRQNTTQMRQNTIAVGNASYHQVTEPAWLGIIEMAKEYGVEETRFPKKDDDCILCGLCTRVCEERMGVGAVSFTNRGSERKVGVPYDKHSPICITCGAWSVAKRKTEKKKGTAKKRKGKKTEKSPKEKKRDLQKNLEFYGVGIGIGTDFCCAVFHHEFCILLRNPEIKNPETDGQL